MSDLYGQRMLVYPYGFLEEPQEVYEPSAFDIPFEDLRLPTSDGFTIACHLLLFEDFYKEFCQYKASAPLQGQKKRKRKRSEVRLTPGSSQRKDDASLRTPSAPGGAWSASLGQNSVTRTAPEGRKVGLGPKSGTRLQWVSAG
ncbi:hypothetical protein NMY22_g20169 [Coprinellus aureogranulatus]|nr:hypothetical protein NMY22_g20169 [Coprinellus aureogranulatus]